MANIPLITTKIFILLLLLIYAGFFIVMPKEIPKEIPKSMKKAIEKLKRKKLTDLNFVKAAYELVNKRYTSEPGGFLRYPSRMFQRDLTTIWNTKKFQPCANQNYVLKIFLIKSKRFREQDIKLKLTTKYIFWPHQYLKIKIKNKWYEVDLWGADHKIPFNDHFCLIHKKIET